MTVAFVGATLPVGKRFREVNTLTVETGVKHSLTKKEARFFAFLCVAILAVLLLAEYLLLY